MNVTADHTVAPSRSLLRPDLVEVFTLLAVALAVSYQIFVPPIIGIADNGDFSRFMLRAGLEHQFTEYPDKYFLYANSIYKITPPNTAAEEYTSSTELFVRAARWLNIGFIDRQVFDMRMLGGIYLALYLLAVYFAIFASRPLRLSVRVLLSLLIVLILTDAGYVAYFNTFYSEPTALTCLLLAAGCALLLVTRQSSGWLLLVLYFTAASILITSKPMHVPVALPLGLFGLYLSGFINFRHRYKLGIAMACALCVLAVWYQGQSPQWLRRNANYIGIFLDLLPNSATPEQDLLALGLGSYWHQFIGTNPYSNESPLNKLAFINDFETHINTTTLPMFYLLRPARLVSLTQRCSRNMLITRLGYFGYYDKNSGKPPKAQAPGLWSDVRDMVFPKRMWFLIGFFLLGTLATIIGAVRMRKMRGLFALYGTLLGIAAIEFIVPSLLLGVHDLARLFLLFTLIFDVSLIVFLVTSFSLGTEHLARLLRSR